jgi:hypothetical protein
MAQRVHDGCPHVEAQLRILCVLRAHLGCDGGTDLGEVRRIPRRGEADGLREDGRDADPAQPVQGLGSGVKGAKPQAFDGGLVLVEKGDLLVDAQLREQILDDGVQRHNGVPHGRWEGKRIASTAISSKYCGLFEQKLP